jgi:hypothetical protein
MTATYRVCLHCELCKSGCLGFHGSSATEARKFARTQGWRRDKIGRDICPRHPKLKGSR